MPVPVWQPMSAVGQELERTARRHVADLAATLDPLELGTRMGDHLVSVIPELADIADEDFRAVLVMSCAGNLAAIREGLITGTPADDATPPPDATAWAHELVHRGKPLAALLRAYRLGHWLFEQTFEEAASEIDLEPDVRLRVLAAASQHCFAYIDIVCTQLVDVYEQEREQWLRGAAAAQAELVQAILAGEPVDAADAAATLHYDVSGPQTAFIVWGDAQSRLVQGTSPSSAARRLAAERGAAQCLVVPVGEHAAWAWTSGDGWADALPTRSAVIEDRFNVAFGGTQQGLDGMRRSHREARAARRVGEVFGLRPGVIIHYPAVSLSSLLSSDPEQAVDFIAQELGELAGDSDAATRLRATVAVYLEERSSPSRTARRLGIHQNTVIYRVRRAEEMLGRSLDERRLELECALRLFAAREGLRDQAEGPAG